MIESDARAEIEEPATDTLELMEHWIIERENIRRKKENNEPTPWTDDPILAEQRFGNVVRADDLMSRWLLPWYRESLDCCRDMPLGQQLAIAAQLCFTGRLVLWPNTLKQFPVDPFQLDEIYSVLRELSDSHVVRMFNDTRLMPWDVMDRLESVANMPPRINPDSVRLTHGALQKHPAIGAFLAGQITNDLMQLFPDCGWLDKHPWAPIGPAAVRGLRVLFEEATASQIKNYRSEYIAKFRDVILERGNVPRETTDRMTLLDWHNVLCEASRYVLEVNKGGGGFTNPSPLEELLGEGYL